MILFGPIVALKSVAAGITEDDVLNCVEAEPEIARSGTLEPFHEGKQILCRVLSEGD